MAPSADAPEDAPAEAGELASLAEPLGVLGNEKRLHLLSYLTTPHYIREIASELGITRQSAQAHVDKLVEIGVVERRRGRREQGPVTDFVVVPQRLFALQERFGGVGRLEPEVEDDQVRAVTETLERDGDEAPSPTAPRLVIVHGFRQGQVVPLTGGGPWMIGRETTAQVCLDYDPFVSSRHAEIRRADGPGFAVADLYSRNGTRVDGETLDRGGTAELESGTVLGIGRSLLVFRTP